MKDNYERFHVPSFGYNRVSLVECGYSEREVYSLL